MAIKITYQQTNNRQFNQFQQQLASALLPITSFPTSTSTLLTEVSLISGTTVVPTMLNRTLIGWYIVRMRANAVVWDSQDTNPSPTQTLILNATAPVVVDLVVF